MTVHAITSTTVLNHASGWSPVSGVDVVIGHGVIMACGTGVAAAYPDATVTDGCDLLLTPGLVNAHCHSAEALARGRAAGAELDDWLPTLADIDDLTGHEIALAVELCAVEQLRSGVTSVVDHFRQIPAGLEAGEAVAHAWETTGLRTMVALMVRDRANPDGTAVGAAHSGPPPRIPELRDLCEAWLGGTANTPGVTRGLGPSAVIRCTEDLLAMLSDLAARTGAPFHVHIDETSQQAEQARAIFDGQTAVTLLHELGALGPQASLVHCVHVTSDDLQILAETGTTAVHCPVANQRLGSGIAPVQAMREAGVAVSLATDGAASNDSQSMTEVIKAALLLARTIPGGNGWLMPNDVLEMAVRPGARPFLAQHEPASGAICEGAPADIAAFDLNEPVLMPANDLAAQLAFSGGSLRARHVWIGGEHRLADGQPTGIDIERLSAMVKERALQPDRAA